MKNGQELPDWISYNPVTGEIVANPPEDVEKIALKIITENESGELTATDLEIEFTDNNNALLELEKSELSFVSLNQQLISESENLDNYGNQIINYL